MNHLASSEDSEPHEIELVPRRLKHVTVAAARGVHIMCEKPLATTVDDADAILKVVAETRVGLSLPIRPVFQARVRQVLDRLAAVGAGLSRERRFSEWK